MDLITNNMLFGIILSLIAFECGLFIYKKTRSPLFNPLLIAIVIVIALLTAFHIDVAAYNTGGNFINMFLGPATVVLAVPLYKQLDNLKKNLIPIVTGIFAGTVAGISSIAVFSYLFGLNSSVLKSIIPKSVTTPIGVEISKQLGGIVPITVLAILITGIIGAILSPLVCKIFKIKDPVAVGVAIGTSSHAVGTTKALEIGEIEGSMSGLSIGISGIMTVFIAPFVYYVASILFHFT